MLMENEKEKVGNEEKFAYMFVRYIFHMHCKRYHDSSFGTNKCVFVFVWMDI